MPKSKASVARELARNHYAREKGMHSIYRLVKAKEAESDFDEPVKLLEVNKDTLEAGVQPLHFGAHVRGEKWYPPVILIVVTPDEFKLIHKGELALPHGWQIGEKLPRQ